MHILKVSQAKYEENVLKRFNMHEMDICTPLTSHFQLSKEGLPKSEAELEEMERIIMLQLLKA